MLKMQIFHYYFHYLVQNQWLINDLHARLRLAAKLVVMLRQYMHHICAFQAEKKVETNKPLYMNYRKMNTSSKGDLSRQLTHSA